MVQYEVIDTTDEHIEELAETMSQADVDEVWASSHRSPLESLLFSSTLSADPTTGLADGEVMCIFGVSPISIISGSGSPWLLGSDLIREHFRIFLRGNKEWMKIQQGKWDTLSNHVDARHTLAIRWLKWLEFDFDEAKPHGPDKMPFHRFSWEQDNV